MDDDMRINALVETVNALEAERDALREALEFYADPNTYFAIGIFPDPPCGEFNEDFDDTEELGWRPGKRARAALAKGKSEV